ESFFLEEISLLLLSEEVGLSRDILVSLIKYNIPIFLVDKAGNLSASLNLQPNLPTLKLKYSNQWEKLGESRREFIAAKMAKASIKAYLNWLSDQGEAGQNLEIIGQKEIEALSQNPTRKQALKSLNTVAKQAYPLINKLVITQNFTSRERRPKSGQDIFNTFLDGLYQLFYLRLAASLEKKGLNAHLGFINENKPYASLALDLNLVYEAPILAWLLEILNQTPNFYVEMLEKKERLWVWAENGLNRMSDYLDELDQSEHPLKLSLKAQIQALEDFALKDQDLEFYPKEAFSPKNSSI
ncbi:MAG: CRISPR-associated endonuclease Cas1, partial [Desulfovibrionaceae bacterium]|nr:CRISPR-associated endonuclease Cas1 [Desulfovibrionaceae bacterium]